MWLSMWIILILTVMETILSEFDPYLIFVIFLHSQIFWWIKFTPKNANFLRLICKKRQFFALNL